MFTGREATHTDAMAPRLDDDDDWDDDDLPEEGDEDAETPCPYCGAPIYDDAVRCPHCGEYLSAEDAPYQPRPWWLIAGVVAGLIVILQWIFG